MTVTPLDVAMALRTAADFCEDPGSPKIHGQLTNGFIPWGPDASRWCAIGCVERELGEHLSKVIPATFGGRWVAEVAAAFDCREYGLAALRLRDQAELIEVELPISEPVARVCA